MKLRASGAAHADSSLTPVGPETDYHGWLVQQATVLRSKQPTSLDWDNLAEELEAMAARERRDLVGQLRKLLAHLLKWQYQPYRRGENSWRRSILLARDEVSDVLGDSPSLANKLPELLPKAYKRARVLAGTDMDVDKRRWDSLFPEDCPWTFDELIDENFLPTRSGGHDGHNS